MGQKVLTGDGVLVEVSTVVNENDGILSGDSTAKYPVWDSTTSKYSPVTLGTLKSSLLGYKSYRALITQTSTSAPTVRVVENELSAPIVWSYNNVGVYYGTLADAFTDNKTLCICHVASPVGGDGRASRVDATNVVIQTMDSTALTNGILNNAVIDIKVYN